MTYLLDSNVWVALLRGTKPPVTARVPRSTAPTCTVCSVIVAELRYGCARSTKSAANRAAVDALLAPYRACRSTTPLSIPSWRSARTWNRSARRSAPMICKLPPSP